MRTSTDFGVYRPRQWIRGTAATSTEQLSGNSSENRKFPKSWKLCQHAWQPERTSGAQLTLTAHILQQALVFGQDVFFVLRLSNIQLWSLQSFLVSTPSIGLRGVQLYWSGCAKRYRKRCSARSKGIHCKGREATKGTGKRKTSYIEIHSLLVTH